MTETSTAIIVGCARSGSTSLFQMLAASPKIAYSKVKEPHFFLRYHGDGAAMLAAYDALFVDRPSAALRLEATAIYFYAVPDVPAIIQRHLPGTRIIVIIREPYDRLLSEFKYLKTRLLIPPDLSLEEYVRKCMELSDDEWRAQSNRHLLGVRNGYYDRYFPEWMDRFGAHLKVVFYDDLVADAGKVMDGLTDWLGVPRIKSTEATMIQNKGVSFRHAGLQRLAVGMNDRLETVFRRNPSLKAWLRSAYYRVNGGSSEEMQQLPPEHPLRNAYSESTRTFREQLVNWDPSLGLPPWLT